MARWYDGKDKDKLDLKKGMVKRLLMHNRCTLRRGGKCLLGICCARKEKQEKGFVA